MWSYGQSAGYRVGLSAAMKEILIYKRLISFGMELDETEWYVKRNKRLWNCTQWRKSCPLINKFEANCTRGRSTVEILRTEHTIMESRFVKIAIEEKLPYAKLHPSIKRATSCTNTTSRTAMTAKYYKTSFKSRNSLRSTFDPLKNGKSRFFPCSTNISICGHFVERPAPVTSSV